MDKTPLVSILMTNYNNSAYIEESLESVMRQTYKNLEIVFVDDHSTDDSVEVAKQYFSQHPELSVTLYVSPDNKGCPASKRKCVELCHGEFFVFVDSDDAVAKDAVERLLAVMLEEGKYSIVYSSQYLCDESLVPQGRSYHCGPIPEGQSNLTSKTGHVSYLTLCSKKCYDQTSGFNVNAGLAEDQDFYFKMEEIAPVRFVDAPLYYYRKHGHNISNNASSMVKNQYWLLKAQTDAYYRRKHNRSNVPNLTKRALCALRLDYQIAKTKSCKDNHQPWRGEMMKVLLYTPFSIRKGFRGIKLILSKQ